MLRLVASFLVLAPASFLVAQSTAAVAADSPNAGLFSPRFVSTDAKGEKAQKKSSGEKKQTKEDSADSADAESGDAKKAEADKPDADAASRKGDAGRTNAENAPREKPAPEKKPRPERKPRKQPSKKPDQENPQKGKKDESKDEPGRNPKPSETLKPNPAAGLNKRPGDAGSDAPDMDKAPTAQESEASPSPSDMRPADAAKIDPPPSPPGGAQPRDLPEVRSAPSPPGAISSDVIPSTLPAPPASRAIQYFAHPTPGDFVPDADEDYWLQGEFVSDGFFGEQRSELTGVQVIALGDGHFEAFVLVGGLPGAGWNRAERRKLAGSRDGSAAVLRDDAGSLVVQKDRAELSDLEGRIVEQFRRVRRVSPTMGQRPKPGAVVIFDGADTDRLEKAKLTEDGLLLAGTTTTFPVGDFRLHLEFRTPYMPKARGQGRGNSGVYIQRRYELQILDSFGLEGIENECGGLYRQRRPDVNMCLPPLVWQTYDIGFMPARFDADGRKISNARIAVLHNGQPIHWNVDIVNKTGAGQPEAPNMLPINLQDHGNPVTYRNVWLEHKDPYQNDGSRGVVCP